MYEYWNDANALKGDLHRANALIARQDVAIRELQAERDALKAERDAFALTIARQVSA